MRSGARFGRGAWAIVAAWLGACGQPAAPAGGSGTSSTDGDSGAAGSTSTGAPMGTSGSSAADDSSGAPALPCNGAAALCERPYDQVVFAGTHNSVAATESGFAPINANQHHPILQQLQDGIRVLLLDVTYDDGQTVLCHGRCGLGSRSHVEVLGELRDFLVNNPREVVTIIYQDEVEAADVEADFVATDLVTLSYTHDGGAWPTLGAMIDADTRLVVTAENMGPPPAWYHHVWDLAWDTAYTYTSIDAFECAPNRGDPEHPLFLLNHWISNAAGLPDASAAPDANAAEVLMARVAQCERQAGRRPTFIAVDYYDEGDLLAVVAALNE